MTPAASVLLPIRNGERWIDSCMRSIVEQTRTDFETLVIDDGCVDQTIPRVLDWNPPGLRVIAGPQSGLAAALALGVRESTSPIIIRQDHDDVSLPERVERQIAFLEDHPSCVAVGSAATVIDEEGSAVDRIDYPLTDRAIRLRMTVECPFVHPSMAMRTTAVLEAGNYWSPGPAPFAEDFHLWSRLVKQGAVANIAEPLIEYRASATGLSRLHWALIAESAKHVAANNMQEWLGRPLTPRERSLVEMFHSRTRRISPSEAVTVMSLLFRARAKAGPHYLPGGMPARTYARPIGWVLREPRLSASQPE